MRVSDGPETTATALDTLCIELTLSCPLRCIHCSANAAPGRQEILSASLLLRQFQAISGLTEIYLSGGEPFAHPALSALIRAARASAHFVVAYSSGAQRTLAGVAPLSEALLSQAREAGLDRVDLSLYAAEPADHDAITQTPGSFAATVASAERVRRAGLSLGVHFVPLHSGESAVEDVLQLAQRLGAERFHVLALAPQGRARSSPGNLAPTTHFLQMMRQLSSRSSLDLILSSDLRRRLGVTLETARDRLRTGFLDVYGYLYPGEAQRGARSRRSLYDGASLVQLLAEVRPAALPIVQ